MEDKHPPHDLEAEQAVLGSILLDPGSIYLLSGELSSNDFYRERNGYIYAAAEALAARGVGIDVVTLCDELTKASKIEEVGGPSYITELMNAVPTATHIVHYASIIREKAKLRRIIYMGMEAIRGAYTDSADSMQLWSAARAALDNILSNAKDASTLLFRQSLEWYLGLQSERNEERESMRERLTFPWVDVVKIVPVIPPGTMILVAAEPAVGKTVFCECLSEHWAQHGFHVAFFHAELSHSIMMDRRMARHSGVPVYDLMMGTNNEAVASATQRISGWTGSIDYIHCPGWGMDRIATKVRQMSASQAVDAVVVDYLQKLRIGVAEQGQNYAQMRGHDAETLKTIGEELGLVTVIGSQRSRANRQSGTLTTSDIRDSNEPLEKCNIAIALGRSVLEMPLIDAGGNVVAAAGDMSPVMSVRVDKHTMGRVGECKLMLLGPRFHLVNAAKP